MPELIDHEADTQERECERVLNDILRLEPHIVRLACAAYDDLPTLKRIQRRLSAIVRDVSG